LFQLFDKLREEGLSNFEKLVPISGDVSEKRLCLSAADKQMLVERVTIIIHIVACVRFRLRSIWRYECFEAFDWPIRR